MSRKKFSNRLIEETSPYLLQHANNPVDWFPWGKEALEEADRQDRPIFLSIGYSACHWCHVMEHESFENKAIAGLMNAFFVNVKVDREERPDLDEIYMNAVQMMTGQGGWPMSVFLTPRGEPFFAGTYFPPDNRYGRPGFLQVLKSVSQFYEENQDRVVSMVEKLMDGLNGMANLARVDDILDEKLFSVAFSRITQSFDHRNGGFGSKPKFPNSMNLSVFLQEYIRNGNRGALEMVILALEKMAKGGIYDQIGGGFHRYSVDERWGIPHFEKMLYDNALLSRLYLAAYQVTGHPLFEFVVKQTLDYVLFEMTHPEGGFYSTQDADSEGEEGKFFVWDQDEVHFLLGKEEGKIFCRYFGIEPEGNFENGKSILNVSVESEDFRGFLNVDKKRLDIIVKKGRKLLFESRERRVKPGRDEKIQASWNGLMISAFSLAYQRWDNLVYLKAAERSAKFILDQMHTQKGGLLHIYKDGKARFNGYQDDYAFLIFALVDLYEASFNLDWLKAALSLTETMIEQFWDEKEGGFFFTGRDHETLIVRSKNPYDNAIPSGNSMGVMSLLRLGRLLARKDLIEKAEITLKLFQPKLRDNPSVFGQMISALDFYLKPSIEVAIIGDLNAPDTRTLLAAIHRQWMPGRVLALCSPKEQTEVTSMIPFLADKHQINSKPTVYVCKDYSCFAPITQEKKLEELLGEVYRTGDFTDP